MPAVTAESVLLRVLSEYQATLDLRNAEITALRARIKELETPPEEGK